MSDGNDFSGVEKSAGLVRLDEGELRSHVDGVVRDTVEQTLNALLEAEADAQCSAKRYERNPERIDTRAGHYERQLHTKAGEVTLQVPRLRSLPFETQIIERYRRRESSVEEALIEMYLAGVSVRRVEDITEALWLPRLTDAEGTLDDKQGLILLGPDLHGVVLALGRDLDPGKIVTFGNWKDGQSFPARVSSSEPKAGRRKYNLVADGQKWQHFLGVRPLSPHRSTLASLCCPHQNAEPIAFFVMRLFRGFVAVVIVPCRV